MISKVQVLSVLLLLALVGVVPTLYVFGRAYIDGFEQVLSSDESLIIRYNTSETLVNAPNDEVVNIEKKDEKIEFIDCHVGDREVFGDFVDPFWDEVAFVIRTGNNVVEKRYPSAYLTWYKRVKHMVFVSDKETEPYNFTWRGRNIVVPKMWDGVHPYAKPGDISLHENAWYKDFVKHLTAFQILYETFPNKTYYIMGDDDTYFFTQRLKTLLSDSQWDPLHSNVLLGMCSGVEFSLPEHSCNGKFPRGAFFPAGGAGIVLSATTMKALYKQIPTCMEKYKECWAGDRRLGACLFDAGISWCNSSLYHSRDMIMDFNKDHWQITTLHKLGNEQTLLTDLVEQFSDPPGDLFDDYFHPFWEFMKTNNDW